MGHLLTDVEPVGLWDHFYKLTQIPHPSGGERAICLYICDLAKRHGLEATMDKAGGNDFGNIIVKCPATSGYEKAPTAVFQSHLDMVSLPVRHSDVPLDLILDGTMLRARGSTLGADNGIAVAMALSLITEPDIPHGSLELLFTINEEAGMTGAIMLSDKVLQGRILINIDSQQEDTLTVSSAGANISILCVPLKMEAVEKGFIPVRIRITGGRGGHSGLEINSGRANAGILLTRLLYEESKKIHLNLNDISWGNVDNAIPPEAGADILVRPDDLKTIKDAVQRWEEILLKEYGKKEGQLRVSLDEDLPVPDFVMNNITTERVLSLLIVLPHGVHKMSSDMEDLVETSSNVARVRTSRTELTVNVSQRSSVDSSLDAIIDRCEAAANLSGAQLKNVGTNYGWKPDMKSQLLAVCQDAYWQIFGKEPRLVGIHGMLECGLIKAKYPDMDLISMGPTILDAHAPTKADFIPGVDSDTTGERIDIARMPGFWEFIKTVLKKIALLEMR
jgi:dipeptidase D